MKLVRYSVHGSPPRLGSLVGDQVRCLGETYHRYLAARGVVRAGELAHALFPPSTRSALGAGAGAEDALAAMDDAVRAGRLQWTTHPLSAVKLHAPLHDPEKFICIGLNYTDHAQETNSPIPKEPPLFAKFPTAIIDCKAPIVRPRGCHQLDYEVELAFVMGRQAKDVAQENALDYVWGYTIINDVSARDFQFMTTQWMAGKICDSFAPMGPWIADRAEIPDPHGLELSTWVNGTRLQHGNSKNLIYNINVLVAYLSAHLTLMPGDIVATGTPAGVGFSRKPPVLLKAGDVVRMEITGLGSIENPVADA
ncbi:MAG TPA: fumarylacetoacetate hydrolase family protein [Methylomirabilota bacterium]|jgi:acylpyruvate hydrolase|nr:fumarylacetoacetate hydrolase family protein [Methylomirabilota bacterium]